MKLFLLKIFTWWNGQTFGTQLWTWRFGELVGADEQGNRYYRTKGRKIDPSLGFERRWVVYNGYAEATRVPPSWHGWLHHTVDVPPTEEAYTPHEWEKPHIPNMTGTPAAYRPPGSTLASGRRPRGDRRLPALDAAIGLRRVGKGASCAVPTNLSATHDDLNGGHAIGRAFARPLALPTLQTRSSRRVFVEAFSWECCALPTVLPQKSLLAPSIVASPDIGRGRPVHAQDFQSSSWRRSSARV